MSTFDKRKNKWCAKRKRGSELTYSTRYIHLGYFDSKQEADRAELAFDEEELAQRRKILAR